jgi:hypothetical protein
VTWALAGKRRAARRLNLTPVDFIKKSKVKKEGNISNCNITNY